MTPARSWPATLPACWTCPPARPARLSPSRPTRFRARPPEPGRRSAQAVRPRPAEVYRPPYRRTRRPAVCLPGTEGLHVLHQQHRHPDALPQAPRPRRGRPREHHQPPGPLHDRQPALQRQGNPARRPDNAAPAAGTTPLTSALTSGRHNPGVGISRRRGDACGTERQAREVLAALTVRMEQVGLQLHAAKTRIVVRHEAARSEWIRRWEGRRMSVT